MHLREDEIYETDLTEEEGTMWLSLPPAQQLGERYHAKFRANSWEFGSTVIDVIRCPACPKDATADPETLAIKAALEDFSEAYHAFYGYSLGNQIRALWQCRLRGLQPGPIATYKGWEAKSRQVNRGENGIELCMAVTFKDKRAESVGLDDEDKIHTAFVYKPFWFVLAQTDGDPIETTPIPDWDRAAALVALGITETPFERLDGNCLGYAKGQQIAINPLNPMPYKTK